MNEDKFKQLFNKTIDKMISNPDELFDNHKLTKKYNEKLKENIKLKKQLEAYENMRKEAIEYIENHIKYENDDTFNGMQFFSYHLYDFDKKDLLNILNKVGGSDE